MSVTVGFIGTGNMGGAIAIGLAGRKDVDLVGFDLDLAKMDNLREQAGLRPLSSAGEVAGASDYLILAVKPHFVENVLATVAGDLKDSTCLVSIAAGLATEKLKSWSGGRCPVVRVMPNTPAMVGKGVFAICLGDPGLTNEQRTFLTELFASQGQVHVLEERLFDAFTAVAGSGPAYVYYVIESLVEAAVTLGLPRETATDMVLGLFAGSIALAEQDQRPVSQLREMVCSPGGSTIAGINAFDSRAVRGALIEGVKAAWQRNRELGE